MKRKKSHITQTKRAALLMIFLIITLPAALAQQLNVNTYSGEDRANGAIRPEDNFTIEVAAQIPGDSTIQKDQVRLTLGTEYIIFDSCVKTSDPNYYTCTFTDEVDAFEHLPFIVELWDDDNKKAKTANASIIVDALSPIIKTFNITPDISNGNVDIDFRIEDYALSTGDLDTCSGIKSATFVSQQDGKNTTVATKTGTFGECVLEQTFPITIGISGTQDICIYTKDFVNHETAPKCIEITVDHTPPNITSINIVNQDGDTITHVHSGHEIDSTVHALITDDGIVPAEQVFSDFSKLSPTYGNNVQSDYQTGNVYTWTQIPVTEVSPCTLTIKATDTLGNTATKNIDCSIKADDTAPILKGHKLQAKLGDESLLGFDTPFILEFDEKDNTGGKGIGMNLINAYLDMTSIGLSNFERADTCSNTTGTLWECAWLVKPPSHIPQGKYEFILVEGTSDDLDNFATFGQKFDVIYDNDGPDGAKIEEFKITSGAQDYTEGAIKGDTLNFVVSSANFSKAYANFSDFGGEEFTSPVELGCSSDNSTVNCTYNVLVNLEGPYMGTATFTFVDEANNKAQTSKEIFILGVGEETSANFWTIQNVQCTPKLIDRETASTRPPYATCRVNLRTPRADIAPLSITTTDNPSDCAEINAEDKTYLREIHVNYYTSGKKDMTLTYVLDAVDYKEDNITITCPLVIRSKKTNSTGTYAIAGSQTLKVNTTFEFYNNPAGEAYKNLDSKIKRALDNGFTTQNWLGDLQEILFYAKQICTLFSTISVVLNAIAQVTVSAGITGSALVKVPYGQAAGKALENTAQGFCNTEVTIEDSIYGEQIKPILNTICGIATCQSAADDNWSPDINWLGGGVPWCRGSDFNIADFGIPQLEMMNKAAGGGQVNIRDSLVLSAACLCLPGIIYNLEKMRQIWCFEAVCYHDMVKENGYPVSFCNGQYNYMWCTFVINEVFAGAPFVGLFNRMMDMAVSIVSNPLIGVGVAFGAYCKITCPKFPADGAVASGEFIACSSYKLFAALMEGVSVIWAMAESGNDFWRPVQNNYCERADDIRKEYKD